jgi:MEMO1 family protein
MASVHNSPYSGSWYPGAVPELQELLASVEEESRRRTGPALLPNPSGFLVPHAGLKYSGTVAAAVYRHIRAHRPERILLLGFSHHGGPRGVSLPDIEAYATPLGTMRVDGETVQHLLCHPVFHKAPEERVCDHSVEIQLPLLQQAAPDARIVPLYVGLLSDAERRGAADILAKIAGPRSLLVASSDLTHFGREFGYQPFRVDGQIAENLRNLDRDVMDAAGSLDCALFLETLRETGSTVCGRAPVALLLDTLARIGPEEIFQQTLDYQTSGEITGDFAHSVSYGALGYFPASSFLLGAEEQDLLLRAARDTLGRFTAAGDRRGVPPEHVTPPLTWRAGVFVTLHQAGKLRGCIGHPEGRETLARAVPELTLAAALDDPRFPPVSAADADIDIEISVLTPLKRIAGRDAFRLHEHGAHLTCGTHCSLLLPQVTRDRDWSAAQFWDALARKSGRSGSIYDDTATRLHVFRAQVIP